MFGKYNIFSTQKCSFQQNWPENSRENGKTKQQWAPYIINNFKYLS